MAKILNRNFLLKLSAFLAVLFCNGFFLANIASAAVTVTPATGGINISADKATNAVSPAYTTLGNIVIASKANNDFAKNKANTTLILTAPSGWTFNAGVGSGSVAGTGITFNSISVTSSTITITYSRSNTNSSNASLTISGIQVRSTNGSILPNSGSILRTSANPGTATIVGITNDVTNFGSLSQVVGAKNKLAFTTQPSSSVLINTDFSTKPVITLQDQFSNTVTTDNSSTITRTAILSTEVCGGVGGSGVLSSTPVNNSAVTAGVLTYTAMQYSFGESIKICATSAGVTSALSNAITVNNPVPTTTSISPTTTQVGDPQFNITVNGTGFISNSTVLFGGITESTTYVSPTQLTAVIPTTDFPTAGNYNVRAFNPTPGGGQSNAQTFTVTSAVDATAPTVTAFTIPSTSSSLTVSITTFTATDNVAVTGYLLTESATTPSGSDSGWASTAPTSYVFSTAGSKTLYAWAKDAAGNISASLNASVTITLADNTAPAAVTDLAASNPTNSSIDLSWTAPGNDGNTGTAVSYDIRYSTSLITSANFSSATQATSIPAPQIAGTHQSMTVTSLFPATTYYFALETSDAVPNTSSISNVPTGSTTSIADTTPPVVTAFSIPSTSNSLTVPITAFTATDNVGVYKYLINESSSTPSVSDSGWSLTVPTSYIFSSGGSKTLYAWAKDAAGNISTSLNASVTITLPATTIITPSQIQSTISGGIIVPNNVLTSSSQVTFTQQVQINFTSGSIMTVPINTVMSTSTNEDFSQLGASSNLGSISVPVNYNFIGGLSFGLPSSSLTSTRDVSISIFAGTQYNGQTAVVFKKSYGDIDWSQINTCVISNGFCQFTSTGFSSFITCLPIIPITSTGGSGIPPKNVIFSGRAYPGGTVKVYRRSPIEKFLVNSTSPDYSIQVDDQGNFSQHFISFFESDYLFFLEGIDKNGIGSGMLTFTANLLSSNDLTVDNIFIPPTINVQNNSVTRGKNVKVTGYAYPGSSIQLRIDNVLIIKSVANDSGYYEATINTTSYSPKTHFIMAKQIDKSGVSSQYSASKNFTVSSLRYPQADFNGDNVIDIKDWSIFLSRWSGNATLRAFDDLNLDGKVDILDFSIFLKAMKGL